MFLVETSKKVILREFEGRMTTLTTSDLHHQQIDFFTQVFWWETCIRIQKVG